MLDWKQKLSLFCWCAVGGIITTEDAREWADMMIREGNNNLELLSQISMYKGHVANICREIIDVCMTSQWFDEESETDALDGIACKRGFDVYAVECDKAIELLEKHPRVEQIFREVFPFIEF